MVGFNSKTIKTQETSGDILKQARKKMEISLEAVEKKIGINKRYLRALEEGDFNNLPGKAYLKGYLKQYIKFLGINEKNTLQLFEEEEELYNNLNSKEADISAPQKKIKSIFFLKPHRIIKIFLIAIIILSCIGYLGWQLDKIFKPPLLIVAHPQDNLSTDKNIIKIIGQTETEAKLTINDLEVLSDQEGIFRKDIILHGGINTIKISASKKHSRENVVYRNILVETEEENESITIDNNN